MVICFIIVYFFILFKYAYTSFTDLCTPHYCRLRDCTYSAPLFVDIKYTNTVDKKISIKNKVQIGRIPIMLQSEKCVLHGKSDKELAELKECMYDPGGYFIVKGTEKVILMHEQLSKNRVILELDTKDRNVTASITSSTHDRKSRCSIFYKDSRVYLKHSNLGEKPIPIVIVLKAMGLESDQEIAGLVGSEPDMLELFSGSLEEPYNLGIYTQKQSLKYIGEKIKAKNDLFSTGDSSAPGGSGMGVGTPRKYNNTPETEAIEILAHYVLNHVPVINYCFRSKVIYITHIIRRVLMTIKNPKLLDDKDYYGNKR